MYAVLASFSSVSMKVLFVDRRAFITLEETFQCTSVSIMGKNMFSGGEPFWPEEAPFHTPVFVLTDQVRNPWVRPGGTTFYFVKRERLPETEISE